MMPVIVIIVVLVVAIWLYMQQPQFGRPPSGKRLDAIRRSPNYRDGSFQNLSVTPALTEGASYSKVMREFFFNKSKLASPPVPLPSIKTDLKSLDGKQNIIVWFGHSSYFMQLDGKKILVDPVFSGSASPIAFTTRSFKGTDIYTPDDMPEIDYLFISHDHYDHLDYKTILALKPKVKTVIAGLGVGAHFERWGYDHSVIIEKDWNQEIDLGGGFKVNTVPARHFSGRKFKRNNTLWMAYVLTTPNKKILIGGDSGYDTHFVDIGNRFGPFDLVILEDGQYDKSWKYIHMMPEEVVQAAKDLKAKLLFPVHWSKFALGNHNWDDPIRRVVKEAKKENMPVMHPMIGEPFDLDAETRSGSWWVDI
jgi:L-ascorbate metabolism protein UlaG (beta-lactamase superfamily)